MTKTASQNTPNRATLRSDKKLPIGTMVYVKGPAYGVPATVIRHGRDAAGVYTEIRWNDTGVLERVHRSVLVEN